MPVGTELADRLDELLARAQGAEHGHPPLPELDDLLSSGYACALAAEARLARGDDLPERGVAELRAVLQRLQREYAARAGVR